MSTRIPRLVDQRIIEAFFGGAAQPYGYTVTVEDFDEFDNEGPGEYYGVEVPAELAAKWDAGLAQCKAAGVQARSREGLAIRHGAMHGTRVLPLPLEEYLSEQDAKAGAAAEQVAAKQALIDSHAAVVAGFASIGPDKYSGQFWGASGDLPCLWEGYLPFSATETSDLGSRRTIYQLPNGDLMETINGQSWTRWTKNAALLADRERRAAIKGHVYAEPLRSAIVAAKQSGALKSGAAVYLNADRQFAATGIDPNYSSGSCATAAEQVVRLRDFIAECIEQRRKWDSGKGAEQIAELEALAALVTDDSITEWADP